MKKLLILSLAILLLLSISSFAQEKKEMKMEKKGEMAGAMQEMTPPAPLSSDWLNWMIGEWEGTSESQMGKTKDWIKFEWTLDKQFVVIHYKGQTLEMKEEAKKEMGEKMDMSEDQMSDMMKMTYKGLGVVTQNAKTGEFEGYWFDNWRGVSQGKGSMEGANRQTMVWDGPMGKETRTTEKVSDNKMVVNFTSSGPMGEYQGKSELTRVKASSGSGTK